MAEYSVSKASADGSTVFRDGSCTSSRDVGWTSLLIDHHVGAISARTHQSIATEDQEIGVALFGDYVAEHLSDGTWHRARHGDTAVCIHRPGVSRHIRLHANSSTVVGTAMLYIPRQRMDEAADHLRRPGLRSASVLPARLKAEPSITQVTRALLKAMDLGSTDFYAESAAAWLSVYLLTMDGRGDAGPEGTLDDARLKRAVEFMSAHYSQPITLERVAAEACVSKFHFARLFRRKLGKSPHAYLMELRLDAARILLQDPSLSIKEVAHRVGYASSRHFITAFKVRYSLPPATFRRDGLER